MPKDFKIPQLPSNDSSSKSTKKYIDEAIEYTNKNFPKNYGTTDGFLFQYHKTSKNGLKILYNINSLILVHTKIS